MVRSTFPHLSSFPLLRLIQPRCRWAVSGSVSWRLPLLLQMLPAVILLAALCTIFPTSPRWLAAQKDEAKQAEGRRVLAKLRQKGVDSQEVVEEYVSFALSWTLCDLD